MIHIIVIYSSFHVPNPVLHLFCSSSCVSAFCYFSLFKILFLYIHLRQFSSSSFLSLSCSSLFQILFLYIHLSQFSSSSSLSLPCRSLFQILFLYISAAEAFCYCPAIISHRPRSQNILKERALNPEEDSRIKRPRSQVSLEKSLQNYKPLEN